VEESSGGTDSSPGFGGSRWPWRGIGVDENCRWCRRVDDVDAFATLNECCEALRRASLIPRCAVVELLDRLEKFRILNDAPVVDFDEKVSDRLRRLTHARIAAMMYRNQGKEMGKHKGENTKSTVAQCCITIIPWFVRRQPCSDRLAPLTIFKAQDVGKPPCSLHREDLRIFL
jgi:hypothetical protein